ncbi:MAG: proton-conducting transporter transmembrane domain-containing protein, partial [Acidimicrobiales bacterium]
MKLVVPHIQYLAIMPVIVLFAGSLVLLFATALVRTKVTTTIATAVTSVAALAALVLTFFQWHSLDQHGASTTVAHAIALDGFSVVASGLIAVCLLMATLVGHDWAVREGVAGAEYQILALAASAGAVLMTQANDLIVVFLGLEILSIALYVLVAFDRHRRTSAEAALKYFLLGSF